MSHGRALLFTLLCLAVPDMATAEPRFVRSEIPFPGTLLDHRSADFNGDGRADLVLVLHQPGAPRVLRIHLQREDKRFPARPDRIISIKKDIVAWSLAETDPDPGVELVLFTRSSCFAYRTGKEGYAAAARRLFTWEFICDVPDAGQLPFLEPPATGASAPGGASILVPGTRSWALFGRATAEAPFVCRDTIPVSGEPVRPSFQRGRPGHASVRIGNGPPAPTDPGDYFLAAGADPSGSGFLQVEQWLPALHAEVLDATRWRTLHLEQQGEARTLVIRTSPGESSGEATVERVPAPPGDSLSFESLDADPHLDMVAREREELKTQVLRLYRSRAGRFDTAQPDQIFRFSAVGARVRFVAGVTRDPGPLLVVTTWDVPGLTDLEKEAAVERKLLVYRPQAGDRRLFERRPSVTETIRITADDFEGSERAFQFARLPGHETGRDLLTVDMRGTLTARHLSESLELELRPSWRFVPEWSILNFQVLDLGGQASDLVLQHRERLTVLVSEP